MPCRSAWPQRNQTVIHSLQSSARGWVTNLAGASVSESSSNGVPPDQYVNVTITSSTNVTVGVTNQFLRLQVHR
jgi:hypothetical protein